MLCQTISHRSIVRKLVGVLGLFLLSCLILVPLSQAADPATGDAVIRAMFERYQGDWYETVKFTQKSTTYNPDGTTKVETWYEAALLPGKLRIDFGSPDEGNAAIFSDGKLYLFQKGKLSATREELNLLLVLGFDVYRQPPEKTIAQLKQEGCDLSKVHEATWQGEPAYVVGADAGDLKAMQFWIEKKSLLFVRILEPDRRDPAKLDDVRFLAYKKMPKGWIAERVEVQNQGRLAFSEDYSDVESGIKLDPNRFDPKAFEGQHATK